MNKENFNPEESNIPVGEMLVNMLHFAVKGFRYIYEKKFQDKSNPQITVPYTIENFDWENMKMVDTTDERITSDEVWQEVIVYNVLAALSDFHVIFFRGEDDISVKILDGIKIKDVEGKTVADFQDLFDRCRTFQYLLEDVPPEVVGGDTPSAWFLISFRPLFIDKEKKQVFFPIEVHAEFYNTDYSRWNDKVKGKFWKKLNKLIDEEGFK